MKKKLNSPFSGQRGMALLMTLLVTAVLTTVVMEYHYDANLNVDITENYKNKMKADYLAKSGIKFAKLFLSYEETLMSTGADDFIDEISKLKSFLYGKPFPLGDGFITLHLEVQEGKVNLNSLAVSKKARDVFYSLLARLEIDETVFYSVIDWVDKDDEVFESKGAEDFYYQALPEPYRCKNAPLDSFDELIFVRGVDYGVLNKLRKFCTIYSNGFININEAPKEVLLSLSDDITEYDVNRIIETREEKLFEDINELSYLDKVFNDIRGIITTKSEYYKVESKGVVDEISYSIVNYLQKGKSSVKLLYSKES